MEVLPKSGSDAEARVDGDLRRIPPLQRGTVRKIQRVLESQQFQAGMIGLIVVNALTLGLETSETVMGAAGGLLAMRKGGEGLKTAIPFGPYLCVAARGARYLGGWFRDWILI